MTQKWTGSLVNLLMGNGRDPEPQVGMGVTELCWTDRHPYEIIEVKDDRHITVRKLDYKRIDTNGMSDCQDYEYYSNPDNYTLRLFKTKDGTWRERIGKNGLGCNHFAIGYAEEYYDFSF